VRLHDKVGGYLINVPLGYVLREKQRPVYAVALRLGAQPGSLFKGSIAGLGLVVCAFVLAILGYLAQYEIELRRGSDLLAQERYREAARVYEGILRRDPDDDSSVFNLALCHFYMEQWTEAAEGFERYLRRNAEDPAVYTFLAQVRAAQGRQVEADWLDSRAREAAASHFRDALRAR
jgi:tetratricopeptide (TPR) repeat protein